MENKQSYFEILNNINVNEHTEEKQGLTYLSWSWAWAEVLKRYPEAQYHIERFGEDQKPYLFDDKLGYMVFTRVSLDGIEKEMWLPVMDGANKSMTDHSYTYQVKDYKTGGYKEKTVEPATMFDINKTIQRCLVKNLAMFGLGIYIYSGEDLPENEKKELESIDYKELLMKHIEDKKLDKVEICKTYKLNNKSTNKNFKVAYDELTKEVANAS